MPEYGKMKNADLEALLKDRGLPSGGKKADMVERLTKDDENTKASMAKVSLGAEDEIDWDDDIEEPAKAAPVTTTSTTDVKPTSAAESVPVETATTETKDVQNEAAAPQENKNEVVQATDAIKEVDGTAEAKQEDNKGPPPDFSKGLAATKIEEEIEKRKKRAAKFGMKIEDDEGLKKLERMKKFGETGPPAGLDEALPERTKKRGREEGDEAGGNKRRGGGRSGGRGGGRSGNTRREHRGDKDNREREPRKDASKANGGTSWMSDKDKQAAEARKAKWAKSTAS